MAKLDTTSSKSLYPVRIQRVMLHHDCGSPANRVCSPVVRGNDRKILELGRSLLSSASKRPPQCLNQEYVTVEGTVSSSTASPVR